MTRKFVLLWLIAALSCTGCNKIKTIMHRKQGATPTPAPSAATPAPDQARPAAAEEPPPVKNIAPAVNRSAVTIALCYHNIDDSGRMKALTISVAEFQKEMQAIKDNGFTVIKMQDFLAWRRGEKDIPAKSALITIDDGWVSAYDNAWPTLKKFGYPFTLFIYINYVGSGGKSLSWDQLAEMRDAGVDIQSHTYSHASMLWPGKLVDKKAAEMIRKDIATLGQDGWMRKEIVDSKKVLEKQLGIKCNVFAYPFGHHTPKAIELVKEAGYEAAFTVYGQQLRFSSPAELLGRYAVEAAKPQIFGDAMKMIGGGVTGLPAPEANHAQLASSSMVTRPMDGETIKDPKPLIKANLATMGNMDPATVVMRVSGLGVVPAKFNQATKMIEYQVPKDLTDSDYTVFINGKGDGKALETKWSFTYDSGKGPRRAPTAEAPAPGQPAPAATPAATPKAAKPKKR